MYSEDELKKIEEMEEAWRNGAFAEAMEAMGLRKKEFKTSSEIELKPLYTPADLKEINYLEDIGWPGQFPYKRGVHPTMYRGRLWTMRQYAGFGTAEESNRRYKYLLQQGQTGLSVAFDLPTQMGYDSDHPKASGEVGRVGVAIASIDDMETLFDGVPLDRVSTSMTINATAAILLAMYIAVAQNRGIEQKKLRGTVQNDILKEYIARGTYIFPPSPSMRIVTDIFSYCKEYLPLWNTISVSGYHIREAGSTAVQEVAFTLGDAIAYVESALRAGLEVDDFAPRLSFFFNVHNNFLEEVAKFRAARSLWAKIMRDRFGAREAESRRLRFHAQTAGCTLTAQQPENNAIRVALQALAAVLGGAQSIHTNSRDEALALPTEASVTLALRTQQIIAYESGVANTIDPVAGSYAIEALTDEIEKRASDYLDRIDAMGGMLIAIENGYVQKEIQEAAFKGQKEIERKGQIIVGLNAFASDEGAPIATLKIDPTVEAKQMARLAALKSSRDSQAAQEALRRLKKGAQEGENLMPLLIRTVKSRCSIGEICDALRSVFGVYRGLAIF